MRIEPPRDRARALVVGALAQGAVSAVAGGSWSEVPHLHGASAGGKAGRAGSSLSLGAASIARGDADEALVVGVTAGRVYALRLTRFR